MRRLQIKFPSQIRISGWDFGSSARAMNQAGGKDSLMTYLRVFFIQAESGKCPGSTFERKTMSSTIKRVALVAVAALSIGTVSTVSANAASISAWTKYEGGLDSINLTLQTSAPTAGSAVYVNVGAVETSTGTVAGATTTGAVTQIRGFLSSYPAGSFASVTSSTNVEGSTAGTATVPTGASIDASSNILAIRDADDAAGLAAYSVTSSATTGIGSFLFTPTVAGTYELKVWNDGPAVGASTIGNNQIDSNEAVQTIVITVVAATTPVPSATYSTISAWDATAYSKAAGTDAGTAETVTIRNTSNAALNGQTVRAVVTGPGTVKLTNAAATTVLGRDVSLALAANENTVSLLLEADGNSGKATVDVYAGTTKILTTAAITFYGTLATLKVTQNKSVVGKNADLLEAVTISGLDAEGIAVPLADNTVVGTSSDTTVLLSKIDAHDSATSGVLTVKVVGANDLTTTSGRSATITWKYLISGTTYTPEVVNTFTIGGALNSVSITLDDTNYAPGALVTATILAKDASGNAAADGVAIAAATVGVLTSSVALQGLATADISTVGGKATTTFYAPAAGTGFSITAKYNDASAVAQKATATATLANVAADAVDAANEATDAANAATDAANAAAEAADAATAAAQDAQAAVAALATQVASLIAGIKAQITTLTNLVIKIQKKVKA